jgi:SNF2 family DNA or RNA helicase
VLIIDGKQKSWDRFRNEDYDIAIINFEKTWRNNNLLLISNKTMIIIDESHKIKSADTKIGKYMQKLSFCTPYKTILTATPMGNGYIDLYNQLYFLGYLQCSLNGFKEKYCIEKLVYYPGMKPFKQIISYRNTDYLDMIVSKYARYYERKINDDLIPSEIMVPIKLEEKYHRIAKDRVYEDLVLDKVSSKRIALKSLCSGTIIGNALVDTKDLHREYQLNTYKLDWVKSFLEDFKDRVVIFYMYDHQRDQLYDMITKLKRPCARYCAIYKEKDLFEQNEDAVVLVQYKSGSTGVDWLKASYVGIFYCLPDSYIEYYQAKGRLNRVGQTKKPLYYMLVSKGKYSVDSLNYEALMNKKDFNDDFFAENFRKIEE